MRIQCDVCEQRLARVLCCNDQAALCHECDAAIHEANCVAGRHQRVEIQQTLNGRPRDDARTACDICQEKSAFIFCKAVCAVLCRDCDVALHLPNTPSANHHRVLFTNITVGLDALVTPPPSTTSSAATAEAHSGTPSADGYGAGTSRSSAERGMPALSQSGGGNSAAEPISGMAAVGGSVGLGSYLRTLGTPTAPWSPFVQSEAAASSSGTGAPSSDGRRVIGPSSCLNLGGIGGFEEDLGRCTNMGGMGPDLGGCAAMSDVDGAWGPFWALRSFEDSPAPTNDVRVCKRASPTSSVGPTVSSSRRQEDLQDVRDMLGWALDELVGMPDLNDGLLLTDWGSPGAWV